MHAENWPTLLRHTFHSGQCDCPGKRQQTIEANRQPPDARQGINVQKRPLLEDRGFSFHTPIP
jgi:hypothetical protein